MVLPPWVPPSSPFPFSDWSAVTQMQSGVQPFISFFTTHPACKKWYFRSESPWSRLSYSPFPLFSPPPLWPPARLIFCSLFICLPLLRVQLRFPTDRPMVLFNRLAYICPLPRGAFPLSGFFGLHLAKQRCIRPIPKPVFEPLPFLSVSFFAHQPPLASSCPLDILNVFSRTLIFPPPPSAG